MRNSQSSSRQLFCAGALWLLSSLFPIAAHASTIEPPASPAPTDPLKDAPQPAPLPAAQPILQPITKPVSKPIMRTVQKTGNLLINPDFEVPRPSPQPTSPDSKPDATSQSTADPKFAWWSFAGQNTESWVDFTIAPDMGRGKSNAARLLVDSTGRTAKTAISGVVQEVKGDHVAEKLSGWYFVESWDKNTPKLYLQAVVIVWNDYEARQKQLVNAPSIQIAYTFTGVKTAPKNMTNRKFIVLGDETPKQGEWVHFEVNPREDFAKLWGIDPGQYEFVRVFFELRYDDIHETRAANPAAPPTKATAYYDDVYFGD